MVVASGCQRPLCCFLTRHVVALTTLAVVSRVPRDTLAVLDAWWGPAWVSASLSGHPWATHGSHRALHQDALPCRHPSGSRMQFARREAPASSSSSSPGSSFVIPPLTTGGVAATALAAVLTSVGLVRRAGARGSAAIAGQQLRFRRRQWQLGSYVVRTGLAASDVPQPPQPRVPAGTPRAERLVIRKRPRRNRRSRAVREMVAETTLKPANLIMPVFVHDGVDDAPIAAMPGVSRLGVDTGLLREVAEAWKLGVKSVVVFPKTPNELKTPTGDECFNPQGLAQRAIRNLKSFFPDIVVYTDVALDPYNSLGHDGIVRSDGVILNDETVHQLCRQAVSQAEAGADFVSPSDMMDGRIGAIRDCLDAAGFTDVGIMSYSAKYNSAFYGPFREALDSAPAEMSEWTVPEDKATYQQDPANYKEALLEAKLDEEEGADILMVKPGMPYLDVIKGLREQSNLPIAAYHVSGEYAMMKAAVLNGWLDERKAVLEALLAFKRAGANVILTYYAKQAAKWLQEAGTGK